MDRPFAREDRAPRGIRRGAHLFCGGDFGGKGLEIAAQVLARSPGPASSWRMTVDDYRDALRAGDRPAEGPATARRHRRSGSGARKAGCRAFRASAIEAPAAGVPDTSVKITRIRRISRRRSRDLIAALLERRGRR